MSGWVYILCFATSLLCAFLLFRGFWFSRNQLLLWASLCFLGFTINNLLLFLDLVIFPDLDLTLYRSFAALLGLMVLIYGLIRDTTSI